MAYEKQTWVDNETPIDAAHLNHMEDGIAKANSIIETQGGDTLTWDGNTEGRVTFEMDLNFYKVSDIVLTKADVANGCTIKYAQNSQGALVEDIDGETAMSMFMVDGLGVLGTLMMLIIPYDNYSLEGVTVPEKGIYFINTVIEGDFSAVHSSLTIPGYTGFGQEKIAPSHLYQPDWNQNDATQPDFIKNRPFGYAQGTIVEEQEAIATDDGYAMIACSAPPEIGSEIVVAYNGTEYRCTVLDFMESGMAAAGDIGLLIDSPETGEPFFVVFSSTNEAQMYLKDASAIIKITGTIIRKLDAKFVDAVKTYYTNGDGYLYNNLSYTEKESAIKLMIAMSRTGAVVVGNGSTCQVLLAGQISGYARAVIPDYENGTMGYLELYTAEYVPPTT